MKNLAIAILILTLLISGPAFSKNVKIVVIGDSIGAGYGVLDTEAFPARLEKLLNEKEMKNDTQVSVTNAGVAGSLSSSAVSRVRYYLKLNPQIIALELGGNDGLKGTDIAVIKKNLADAIDLALKAKVKVILLGMQIYTNFGEDYTHAFKKIFADLAKEKKVAVTPFIMEKVATNQELMQKDQKHPNAKGHEIVAENLVRYFIPLVESALTEEKK